MDDPTWAPTIDLAIALEEFMARQMRPEVFPFGVIKALETENE